MAIQGTLWRARIWRRVGADIRALAAERGVSVRAAWAGWRVRSDGLDVTWTGGLLGERTRVRTQEGRQTHQGWLGLEALSSAASKEPPASG